MEVFSVYKIAALAAAKKPHFNIAWRPALMRYTDLYTKAVEGCTFADPCMLAAIVSRESSGQNILQRGMQPGPDCGVGLCQITYGVDWTDPKNPKYPGYGDLFDPQTNLRVAAHLFLEPALEAFPSSHIAGFASFNLGKQGVQREIAEGLDPDTRTTGHDYGHAVFHDWINFTAASLGYNVDWASFKG